MSALTLRAAAILLMLLDHIGYATGNDFFRMIGRISLPIFAFLIANGFRHTRSVPKYVLRLAVFALISEIPYDLYFNKGRIAYFSAYPQLDNIFFTLLAGLCFLWLRDLYKRYLPHLASLCSTVTLLILAFGNAYVSADYGVLGVFWVALFGIFDVQQPRHRLPLCLGAALLAAWKLLTKALSAWLLTEFDFYVGGVPILSSFLFSGAATHMDEIQPLAALAMLFILCYNGKSGMPEARPVRLGLQYAFYVFYPLHILIIWWVF